LTVRCCRRLFWARAWLEDFPLGADLLRCPASKSAGQPVFDRLRYGVGSVCDYSVVQLIMQFRELCPDVGLVLARDFLAPPLAVRAELETDHAAQRPGQ
jgi:hypothetical protein